MEAGNAPSGTSSASSETGSGFTGSTELARNALGLPAILFCIVTGSAPLAAMMFNDPLSGYGMGISVPAGFWIATIAFTLFSVAYIEMARRVTTAGGIYSYMSYGFGRIVGLGAAVAIAAAYILFAAGVNGVTSYFAQTSILNLSGGFDMDWRIYAFCFIFADVPDHVFPRRDRRQDPRHLPDRRDIDPDDLLVRRGRAGRRSRRHRLGGAQPGGDLQRRRGCRGSGPRVRRRPRRRRLLRVLLVVGRLRDGAELRRGGTEPEEDDGLRHLHLLHRPRGPLHVLVVDADQRLRLVAGSVGLVGRDAVRSRGRQPTCLAGQRPSRRATTRASSTRSPRSSRGSASRTSSRC